jgi:hypothetical protein
MRAAKWIVGGIAGTVGAAFIGLYAALIYDAMTGPYRIIDVIRDEWPLYPKVTTSLGHSCAAPCAIPVQTAAPFQLTLSFPGYKDRTVTVQPADWKGRPWEGKMELLR